MGSKPSPPRSDATAPRSDATAPRSDATAPEGDATGREDWVSPYRRDKIRELVEDSLPKRGKRNWFGRSKYRLLEWGQTELKRYASGIPGGAEFSNMLQETARDYHTSMLIRDVARDLLLCSLDGPLPDLSTDAIRRKIRQITGSSKSLADDNRKAFLILVNHELDSAAEREPQLARLVSVRKASIHAAIAETENPARVLIERGQLRGQVESLHAEFQSKLLEARDAVMAVASHLYLSPPVSPDDTERMLERLLGDFKRFAKFYLDRLCTLTKTFLLPRSESTVGANFMTATPVATLPVDVATKSMTKAWLATDYGKKAADALAIVWSTVDELEGFSLPVVRANPLRGAPWAFAKHKPEVVFVDDLEPRWPEEAAELREAIEDHLSEQHFEMFLSFPVWNPNERGSLPIGVVNINVNEADHAFYVLERAKHIGQELSRLVNFFAELSIVTHKLMLMKADPTGKLALGRASDYLPPRTRLPLPPGAVEHEDDE